MDTHYMSAWGSSTITYRRLLVCIWLAIGRNKPDFCLRGGRGLIRSDPIRCHSWNFQLRRSRSSEFQTTRAKINCASWDFNYARLLVGDSNCCDFTSRKLELQQRSTWNFELQCVKYSEFRTTWAELNCTSWDFQLRWAGGWRFEMLRRACAVGKYNYISVVVRASNYNAWGSQSLELLRRSSAVLIGIFNFVELVVGDYNAATSLV